MPTGLDLANLVLFDAGIVGTGQVASGQDSALFLTRLNFMLDEWSNERWLVYHNIDTAKVSTGAQSYTVGPGGDYPMAERPDRLESAFFRQLVQSQPNQIDYPLRLLMAREDYNNIALKQLASFPQDIFYDSAYPLGVIYPWPVPQAAIYEVHIQTKAILSELANLAANIVLPKVYFNALHWNMVDRIRNAYTLPEIPWITKKAKAALNSLRKANTQIGQLTLPEGLSRPGIYSPYSDQIR